LIARCTVLKNYNESDDENGEDEHDEDNDEE
jgi:hypothetical protein